MITLLYAEIIGYDQDYLHITAAYCKDRHSPRYLIHTRRNDIAQRYELLKLEQWNEKTGTYDALAEPVENTPYEQDAFVAFYLALGQATTDEQFYTVMKKLRIKPEHARIPLAHGQK